MHPSVTTQPNESADRSKKGRSRGLGIAIASGTKPPAMKEVTYELSYGFGRLLHETDFAIARANTMRALEEQHFTIVAQVDLQKTLETTLDLGVAGRACPLRLHDELT